MFALIIAIVAIALVVLTVVIASYYGGDQVNKGSDQAKVAALVNQSQQISAAFTFYQADHGGASPASFDALVDGNYLTSLPKLWQTVDGFAVTAEDAQISDENCQAFNARLNISVVPSCSDPAFTNKIVCCTAD